MTVLVDEFHALPGANYEPLLSELAKYGLNVVLATQSLARLDALDRRLERALRPLVFSNVDGLFAFHVSAEDARYLVRELGSGLDEQDLVSLGDFRCYARLSAEGERLPAFSVRLDPPPPADPELRAELAADSAARYGRDWRAVEADIQAALNRVELARQQGVAAAAQAGRAGAGVARDAATGQPAEPRNAHRGQPGRSRGKTGRGEDGRASAPAPKARQTSFDLAAAGTFPGGVDPPVPPGADPGDDGRPVEGETEAAG